MIDLCPNFHQSLAFVGIENDPIARNTLFEELHLVPHKPAMSIAPDRPHLMKQHQQSRQPLGEHRFSFRRKIHKSSNDNSPTFWPRRRKNARGKVLGDLGFCLYLITSGSEVCNSLKKNLFLRDLSLFMVSESFRRGFGPL